MDRDQELLRSFNQLLGKRNEAPTIYKSPQILHPGIMWLDNYRWNPNCDYEHLYESDFTHYEYFTEWVDNFVPSKTVVICHNHTRETICYTPYKCHRWLYRPTGQEHPDFIADFHRKNDKWYGKAPWKVSRENVVAPSNQLSLFLDFK